MRWRAVESVHFYVRIRPMIWAWNEAAHGDVLVGGSWVLAVLLDEHLLG